MPWGALNEDFTEWLIGGRVFFFCWTSFPTTLHNNYTNNIFSLCAYKLRKRHETRSPSFDEMRHSLFRLCDHRPIISVNSFFVFLCNAKFVSFIEWKETKRNNWNSTLINYFQFRAPVNVYTLEKYRILWKSEERHEEIKKKKTVHGYFMVVTFRVTQNFGKEKNVTQ